VNPLSFHRVEHTQRDNARILDIYHLDTLLKNKGYFKVVEIALSIH